MAKIIVGWVTKDVRRGEIILVNGEPCEAGVSMDAGTMCVIDTQDEVVYPSLWGNEWVGRAA